MDHPDRKPRCTAGLHNCASPLLCTAYESAACSILPWNLFLCGKRTFSFSDGAPDGWWESARFQALCVAWSWLRYNGVLSSHPKRVTPAVGRLVEFSTSYTASFHQHIGGTKMNA